MESLTPENNRRNPWFGEYWEEVFDCTLKKSYKSIHSLRSGNGSICTNGLKLEESKNYEQESKVQFVVDAVYAFALALDNLHHDLCGRIEGLCSSMANYDRGAFYKNYLLNVSFVGESDDGARRVAQNGIRNGNNRDGATRHLFASFVPLFFFTPLFPPPFFLPPFRSKGAIAEELPGREGEKGKNAKEMLDEMTLDWIIGEAIDLRKLNSVSFVENKNLSEIQLQIEIIESYSCCSCDFAFRGASGVFFLFKVFHC